MASESGRWYTRDKQIVPDATLTQAKRDLLYPSVTTLLGTKAESWGLTQWKFRQIIMAASTTEQGPDESDKDFYERVLETALHEGTDAAEFGTLVHASIAKHLEGKDAPELPHDLREWIDDNLEPAGGNAATETAVVGTTLGYAGTIDYWGVVTCTKDGSPVVAVVDFKTQKVKAKSPEWYPEWMYQLGGYGQLLASDPQVPAAYQPTAFYSVVINTNHERDGFTPERPGMWVKGWDTAEIQRGARVINDLAALFYDENDKPRAPFPRPGTPERAEAEARLYGEQTE